MEERLACRARRGVALVPSEGWRASAAAAVRECASEGRWKEQLLLILLLAFTLRVSTFNGYAGSDDASYAELAQSLRSGNFHPDRYVGPPVFPVRVGVYAPVALLFQWFGVHEWTIVVPSLIQSFLSIVVTFSLGRLLAGPRVGVLSALCVAVVPLAVRSATLLNADLPAALAGNTTMLLLLLAARADAPGMRWGWAGGAGLCLGVGWLCKESVLYLLPVALAFAACAGGPRAGGFTRAAGLLLGFGVVLVVEAALYAGLLGDPLFRMHTVHRNYEYSRTWFFAEGSPLGWQKGGYTQALLGRLFWGGPLTILASPALGGLTLCGAVAAAYGLAARSRPLLLLSGWFVGLALMFNFASSSLAGYQPLVLFDRYLYPLITPAALLTAAAWEHLRERHTPGRSPLRRAAAAILGVAALLCIVGNGRNMRLGRKNSVERELARRLSPGTRLYSDRRTIRVLRFFWGWPEVSNSHDFRGLDALAIPAGSLVLVNPEKLHFLTETYGYDVPLLREPVPPGWQVTHLSRGAVLYRTPLQPDRPRSGAGPR